MFAAGLVALCIPSSARADRLAATREQPLAEVSHDVTVRIDGGLARYVVRRTFANTGTREEEASLRLDLAHGAAITGMRIRARARWYDGELMEAEEARAKYLELTGIGAWEPKDPALLQWVWADQAHLQVFPVLPGAVSTVEYTLTVPLQYSGGNYLLSYPRSAVALDGSLPLADPVLTVEPGHGDATTAIRLGDRPIAPGAPVVLGPLPPAPWVGEGEPEPGVGYAHSALTIDRDVPVTGGTVTLDIDHTYSGDLVVELVAPDGQRIEVTRGEGGENDLRGSFALDLRGERAAAGVWTLVVADRAGLDVGALTAWSLELKPAAAGQPPVRAAAGNLPVFIPDARDGDGDGGLAWLSVTAPPIRRLDARLGRVVASREHGFARLELDAAPRLGQLPRGASVVFVLDGSRSLAPYALDELLRIVDAYLAHVPDARVEVVVFARGARRLFDDFVPAAEFAAHLERARKAGRLEPANGSALELGLEHAARLLRDRPGPARIVALTDAELRGRFRNAMGEAALATAPRGAIAHIVVPGDDYEQLLVRADDHPLASIATSRRGVLFRGAAPEHLKRRPLVDAMLALVRPVAIDNFAVHGLDLDGAAPLPASMREGSSYRAMLARDDPPTRVVVTGKIWADSFRRVVTHDRRFDVATAGFVFSEDEYHDLSDSEMLTVAFMGRAVSPVTSYLAVEPGVRPSTAGLERDEIGLGGLGLVGHGGGGGGSGSMPAPDLAHLLGPAARACRERHGAPASMSVELDVETTTLEIVDVQTVKASHPEIAACIVEAAWATLLPDADWPARQSHRLRFG